MQCIGSMKLKTSITLSADILEAIDRMLDETENRSAFIEHAIRYYIEHALRYYLEMMAKRDRDNKDFEILNKNSARLNREAEDVLSYQVEL